MKKEVIFINSHPIQYFVPLYKYLNENGISTAAWYCTDETLKGHVDKEFGVRVKWDIPLLDGYKYRFFKNYSPKPSHSNGFFGLINLGMIWHLFKTSKSVIIVHGWHYCTHLLILLLAGLKGHKVCLRYEMPYNQEILKKGWKQEFKRNFLRRIIFPRIQHFLYIGTQNKMLYEKIYKISSERLIFCPYSVDNKRFTSEWLQLKECRNTIKKGLGIGADEKVILYSGKYIDKKRPLDIVKAFANLKNNSCWLVMLGEGELRGEIEQCIAEHKLQKIILTGFVNQSKVAEYYSMSDVFVMCSSVGETWGLSANEALNFNLPLIISDLTGCSIDLVKKGENGFIFETGNVDDLTDKLATIVSDLPRYKNNRSEQILAKYSYCSIAKNLTSLV